MNLNESKWYPACGICQQVMFDFWRVFFQSWELHGASVGSGNQQALMLMLRGSGYQYGGFLYGDHHMTKNQLFPKLGISQTQQDFPRLSHSPTWSQLRNPAKQLENLWLQWTTWANSCWSSEASNGQRLHSNDEGQLTGTFDILIPNVA